MTMRSRLLLASCAAAMITPTIVLGSTMPKWPQTRPYQTNSRPNQPVAAAADLRSVTVDASKVTGALRSLQGFDGSAKPVFPGYPDLHAQFNEVNIDFVRMHDFFGVGDTDADFQTGNGDLYNAQCLGHNDSTVVAAAQTVHDFAAPRVIFPNPNADPNDPRSYNFAATDAYVRDIATNGRKVLFRFGRSQGVGGSIPTDFAKYAEIAKHIVMHYEHGWNGGMIGAVQYYEVWNEPDLGPTQWTGTAAQYYDFYTRIALAVKGAVPEAFIGGPVADFPNNTDGDFVRGFIKYVADNKVPLDFYAWHFYAESYDPYDYYRLGTSVRALLDQYGLKKTQQFVTEWNNDPSSSTDTALTQTTFQAAFVASSMAYMQDASIDHAFYYRGDALYLGMFAKNGAYTPTARAFEALGQLNLTPVRLSTTGQDTLGYTVLAGRSTDSQEIRILISNYQHDANYLTETHPTVDEAALSLDVPATSLTALPYFGYKSPLLVKNLNTPQDSDGISIPNALTPQTFNYTNNQGYDLVVKHLPWGASPFTISRYRIDASHNLDLIDTTNGLAGTAHISATLPPPSVELVVIRENHPR
ncbi:MAG: GH39 family glycosyl hydrolase [Janthinobacterium lividum]